MWVDFYFSENPDFFTIFYAIRQTFFPWAKTKKTFCYRSTPPNFFTICFPQVFFSCFQPKFTRYMTPMGRPDVVCVCSDFIRAKRGKIGLGGGEVSQLGVIRDYYSPTQMLLLCSICKKYEVIHVSIRTKVPIGTYPDRDITFLCPDRDICPDRDMVG